MSAFTSTNAHSNANAKKDFLEIAQWVPDAVTMMQPKTSKVGYDISILSSQLGARLNLVTPYMKTWGIQDFVDPNSGVSSGKYNMVLRFPNDNYGSDETTQFLEKLQKLEEKILDVAYENRGVWFGDDDTTRDVIKSKYFSMLKYQKLKDANGKNLKKLDYSKPPSFKLKVPFYKNKETGVEKWNCQIYDSSKNLLFPCDEPLQTPVNFVVKDSEVKCKISCTSIWVGEKAWGVQWSILLAFVKPKEVFNPFDVSTIDLGGDEETKAVESFSKPYAAPPASNQALDSDDEEDPLPTPALAVAPATIPTSSSTVEYDDDEDEVAATATPVVENKKKAARKPKA